MCQVKTLKNHRKASFSSLNIVPYQLGLNFPQYNVDELKVIITPWLGKASAISTSLPGFKSAKLIFEKPFMSISSS